MSEFKENLLDAMENLHIKLYYPRVSKEEYSPGEKGYYEKLKDYIRYETYKEIINSNPEWDMQEMGKQFSIRIRNRTRIY